MDPSGDSQRASRKLPAAVLLYATLISATYMGGVEAQVAATWYVNPMNSTNLAACTKLASQANDTRGSFLAFAPNQWQSGTMNIVNSSGCMQTPLGELRTYAAIRFEFRGTEVACDATFRLSRYRLCGTVGSSYESARPLIRDYIDTGVISATEWRTVVIPIAVLQQNAALNCDQKNWDLSRLHYLLTAFLCNSCAPGPQNSCSVRNLVFLASVPPPMNKAPRVSLTNTTLAVPFAGVVRIPVNISDDMLPAGSTLRVLWTVVAGPTGWNASTGIVSFSSSSSISPFVAFSTAAPVGNYTLAVRATDGTLSTVAQLLLRHLSTPLFVSVTSPKPPTLSMPLLVTTATLQIVGSLQSLLLPANSIAVNWSSTGTPALVLQPVTSDPTGLTVAATFPNGTTVRDFIVTLTVRVNNGQFLRTARLAIRQASGARAVRLTTPWKNGTRIPFFAEPDLEGTSMQYPLLLQETANVHVAASGTWSSVLASASLRGGDCVLIPPEFAIVFDVCISTKLRCIVVLGRLSFSPTASTCVTVGTLQLHYGGILNITHTGTSAKTVLTFSGEIDTREDPAQDTVGLLAYHSTVILAGRTQRAHRLLASGMNARSTTITVPGASSFWAVGDEIVFADTQEGTNIDHWTYKWDPAKGQTEWATIASIRGSNVTLNAPLNFTHQPTFVGHMTRSIVFQADITAPTRPVVFLIGRSIVQINYTQFVDFGRTTVAVVNSTVFANNGATVVSVGLNQIGRYAVHMHRIRQGAVSLVGNTVWGKSSLLPRHGFVLHDSRGFFTDCVAVGARGSGFFVEDGTESGAISGCLAIGLGGGSRQDDDVRFETASKGTDMGHGGFGFWSRNAIVRFENNAALGLFLEAAYGFYVHNNHLAKRTVPDIPGTPDAIRGKSLPSFASIPFQLYGGFINNMAMGTYRQGLALMYSVCSPYNLVINFTSTALASSGRGLHIIHGGKFLLRNCTFVNRVPGNTITGAFKNNGLGSSVDTEGGLFQNHKVAIGTFVQGNTINQTRFVNNQVDVGFFYTTRAPDGTGKVFLVGYDPANTYRLYANRSDVPADATVASSYPFKTDGVVTVVASAPAALIAASSPREAEAPKSDSERIRSLVGPRCLAVLSVLISLLLSLEQ